MEVEKKSGGMSNNAKIALAIGVGVGLLGVGAIAVAVAYNSGKKKCPKPTTSCPTLDQEYKMYPGIFTNTVNMVDLKDSAGNMLLKEDVKHICDSLDDCIGFSYNGNAWLMSASRPVDQWSSLQAKYNTGEGTFFKAANDPFKDEEYSMYPYCKMNDSYILANRPDAANDLDKLKSACASTEGCVGFLSNGTMYGDVQDPTEWQTKQNLFMYLKTAVVPFV